MYIPFFTKRKYKTFWMVVKKPMKGQNNKSYTSYRHYTKKSALKEAKRLSNLLGRPFLVLQTVERIDPEN